MQVLREGVERPGSIRVEIAVVTSARLLPSVKWSDDRAAVVEALKPRALAYAGRRFFPLVRHMMCEQPLRPIGGVSAFGERCKTVGEASGFAESLEPLEDFAEQ